MDKTPFKYGCRKVGARNNWEDLDKPYSLQNKPAIFIFGGNLTTTTKEANGYAKLINNSFKKFTPSTADIISVSYEGEAAEKVGNSITLSERAKFNAVNFFNQTIYPTLKNVKNYREAEGVLKKLIFVGHSAGVNIISTIMESTENYLLYKFNNDKSKVDNLMGNIQCFCYAPGTAIRQNVTAFYVSPFFDRESTWKQLLFTTSGDVRTQYPAGFIDKFDSSKPISYTNNALKQHKFVAVRRGDSLILITDKLSDKNDHSIACLKNTKTEYSAFVSDISESVLNRFLINSLYNTNYSFHDDFNMLKNYAEQSSCVDQTTQDK